MPKLTFLLVKRELVNLCTSENLSRDFSRLRDVAKLAQPLFICHSSMNARLRDVARLAQPLLICHGVMAFK